MQNLKSKSVLIFTVARSNYKIIQNRLSWYHNQISDNTALPCLFNSNSRITVAISFKSIQYCNIAKKLINDYKIV